MGNNLKGIVNNGVISIAPLVALVALVLSALPIYAQTPAGLLKNIPFRDATRLASSSGRPLMVLAMSDS